jgi:hypothetical protein
MHLKELPMACRSGVADHVEIRHRCTFYKYRSNYNYVHAEVSLF